MLDESIKKIEEILVEFDPVKLIKIGAPLDEYHYEAILICERINRFTHFNEVHKIVYNVFLEQFGRESIIGSFQNYYEISKRISKLFDD